MLAALLLAGIIAAPLGSAGLLLPVRARTRPPGSWPATRRFGMAVLGTIVLAALVGGVLKLLGVSQHNVVLGVVGVACASVIWLPATRQWSARAHLCWASSVFLFVVYLIYALDWTFASHLGPASTIGGVLLWLFEVFAALMSCAYLWEICDALGTEQWRRRITPQTPLPAADRDLPMVSLHVPAHNEPPDMVKDTLRSLLRLDYPRYEIVVIDDNTDDEKLWRPVEEWCARHGVKFAHLENWPGYKSGALNYALRRMTDERAEVIGVVDSDYQLEPGFLRRCAPPFADPWIGFVQSPRTTATGSTPGTTGGCITPTSTSSPCPSPRATSTTGRSSPARWGSSAGSRWTSWAAGTSGASPRTPRSRCGCCGPAGTGCTSTRPGGAASCR